MQTVVSNILIEKSTSLASYISIKVASREGELNCEDTLFLLTGAPLHFLQLRVYVFDLSSDLLVLVCQFSVLGVSMGAVP